MNKLKIIGHRGARKISTENTKKAIESSLAAGVDAIELDVRATKDGILMLSHNRNLRNIYGLNKNLDEITFEEARKLRSRSGDPIPTLEDVLNIKMPVPLMLDVKKTADADSIYKIMSRQADRDWCVTTFYWDKAARFKELDKKLYLSLSTFKRPFKAIRHARKIKADAVTIPLYLLNPLSYRLARRAGLDVLVYMNYLPFLLTTKRPVRLLFKIYPDIAIFTDRPDRIVPAVRS